MKEANLDFWIKNNLNVLFRGRHGTGKTTMIIDAFNRNNLKWKYFSASTMDPWVDFIGVPKEQKDEKGNSFLDLVRPKEMQDDTLEALFLDEYNRSPKKIRNATMELIQFKSINGKKFPNLKIVWVAINPEDEEDEEYDVEKLDPAQLDRFHIQVDVPYAPSTAYFRKKHGSEGDTAIIWWKELSLQDKKKISPRRLDYVLDIYKMGGDIRFVLDKSANVNKLVNELKNGPISVQIKNYYDNNKPEEAKEFLKVENNFNVAKDIIVKKDDYIKFFVPLLSEERTIVMMNHNSKIENFIFSDYNANKEVIKLLANANSGKLSGKAKNIVAINNPKEPPKKATPGGYEPIKHLINPNITKNDFSQNITRSKSSALYNTQGRISAFRKVMNKLPTMDNITSSSALDAINLLCYIVQRSHKETIMNQFQNIDSVMNYFISFILEKDPEQVKNIKIKSIKWKLNNQLIM